MKTLEEIYSVGDVIEVNIVKPKLGNCPIGKHNSNITCIFEKTYNHLVVGTIVSAEVVKINKTHIVVKYVSLLKSVKDIENEFNQKLNEFKEYGFKYGNVIFK